MTTFAKGHGTENDFIILPDPDVRLDLTPRLVAALCGRRSGIGADGVLRVARAGDLVDAGVLDRLPDEFGDMDRSDWFMDYRNADGSIAEICGNGLRVFAHYLVAEGLVAAYEEGATSIRIGTRAGARQVEIADVTDSTAMVSVEMGPPEVLGTATAHVGGNVYAGLGVGVGNPHLACVLPGRTRETLHELDLSADPEIPADMFPDGVNLELLTPLEGMPDRGVGAVHMRVIERGVGETRSCGSGTVAAAVAALADAAARQTGEDAAPGDGADHLAGAVTVHMPGGDVLVEIGDGWSVLTGPSVIVARGEVDLGALGLD